MASRPTISSPPGLLALVSGAAFNAALERLCVGDGHANDVEEGEKLGSCPGASLGLAGRRLAALDIRLDVGELVVGLDGGRRWTGVRFLLVQRGLLGCAGHGALCAADICRMERVRKVVLERSAEGKATVCPRGADGRAVHAVRQCTPGLVAAERVCGDQACPPATYCCPLPVSEARRICEHSQSREVAGLVHQAVERVHTMQIPSVSHGSEPTETPAVSIRPDAASLNPWSRVQPGSGLSHEVVDLLLARRRRHIRVEAGHRELCNDDRKPKEPVVLLDFLAERLKRRGVDVNGQEVRSGFGRDEGEPFLLSVEASSVAHLEPSDVVGDRGRCELGPRRSQLGQIHPALQSATGVDR